MFTTGFSIQCSTLAPNYYKVFPEEEIKYKHIQVKDIISDIFNNLYLVLGDVNQVLGILQVAIDARTIYNEWIAGDYFEGGLFLGKGTVNLYYSVYAIVARYIINQ